MKLLLEKKWLRKIIILAFWLFLWQLFSLAVNNKILLVGPLETVQVFMQKVILFSFWQSIIRTILRIGIGFFVAFLVGFFIALISYRFQLFEEILAPFMNMIKSIPVASFVVLFLIWWNSGVLAVAISFMVVLPNSYVNILEGLKHTDDKLLEMAKVMNMPTKNKLLYVYRPALAPFIESSLKISIGMCWKAGIAAEVIGTPSYSIGEQLYMSKIYLDTAGVLAWTAVTIVLCTFFEKISLSLWYKIKDWEPTIKRKRESYSYKKNKLIDEKISHNTIRISDISKNYQGKKIIEHMTEYYKEDSIYYFRMPSGSGKTTLFRMIAGLEAPDNGKLEILGRLTMVFQEDRLCENYSAVRNVEMINRDPIASEIHLKELLGDEFDKKVSQMSGGMKRRVAIVRAMATPSDIVILDEPFAGLDGETREKVMDYIYKYQNGRTLLIATHI